MMKEFKSKTAEEKNEERKKANTIINYVFQQLEVLEKEKNKNASFSKGRTHALEDLTKGRIIVDFMR